MDEGRFKNWLQTQKDHSKRTINSRISNCKRVEKHKGNLDDHFEKDHLEDLIEQLTYSTTDEKTGKTSKHKMSIDGNIYDGTATLKNAVNLYREFKLSGNPRQIININTHKAQKRSKMDKEHFKKKSSLRKVWPKYPHPTEEEILQLAKIVAQYVRFLHPKIVHEIVKDNNKHQEKWSCQFRQCNINPNIYLWDSSPCAFPGIRRYSGSNEISYFRNRNKLIPNLSDCLSIDDNSFPKQLWAFVLTSRKFQNHGPKGYQLAHIFDHNYEYHKLRCKREIENINEDQKLFGLFTSPASTAYVPTAFLKPTDFSTKLRTLLQRKAAKLYHDVCQILPPPLKVKSCDDPKWDIKNFTFGDCVGDIKDVPDFLKFRNEKIDELFEKFHKLNGNSLSS